MNTKSSTLYDIEDDIIDQGTSTNLSEALSYYQIDNEIKEQLNQKIDADYHNTYYNTRNKTYGTRTIKLANKDWHKLNNV